MRQHAPWPRRGAPRAAALAAAVRTASLAAVLTLAPAQAAPLLETLPDPVLMPAPSPVLPPRPMDSLPDLGDPADAVADSDTEKRLGQAFLRQLQGTSALWPDALVRDYIEGLLYRLAVHAPLKNPKFSIAIVDDREINAFAVPGGIVGVNTGLILSADNEDELAGVLSHELGHISQRHFARSVQDNKYNQWLALGGMLAGIAAAAASSGSSSAGNVGMAMGMSAQAAALQSQLHYSRIYEQEADRIGLQTLIQSGMDPHALPDFFERMDRNTRQLGYIPEFLLTHPLTTSRMADLERRVADLPRHLHHGSLDFQLIKTRLQVDYSTRLNELISAWQEALKSPEAPVTARYGLALAQLESNQPDLALATLQPLRQQDPMRLDYRLAEIDMQLTAHRYEQAMQLADAADRLYPDKRSVLERRVRAALFLQRPNAVRAELEETARDTANDPLLWSMLADCATMQKDAITVFRARAEMLYWTNREKQAEDQLKNALRVAANNYSLTAQLQQRLDDMRKNDAEFR